MKHLLLVPLVSLCAFAAAPAAVITFDSPTTFDSDFPLATRSSAGGASSVSLLSSPGRVDLHAQQASTDVAAPARMTIYSTSAPAYDFLSSAKTFTFSNVGFNYPTGATYTGVLGLFSTTSSSGLTTNADGIYLLIDRGGTRLRVMERLDGNQFVLQEWSNLGANPNSYAFSSIALTLSGTSWSFSALSLAGASYSANGAYANSATLTTANWGSSFYLGLEAQMTLPTLDTSRYLDLTVETIAAVPEPGPTALLGFALGAFFLLQRRRRPIR